MADKTTDEPDIIEADAPSPTIVRGYDQETGAFNA